MNTYAKLNTLNRIYDIFCLTLHWKRSETMDTPNSHHIDNYQDYLQNIIQQYFSRSQNTVSIGKDEILLKEGFFNDRIFYVQFGKLWGYWLDEKSNPIESFVATHGSFIGIPSFFSDNHISLHTVKAVEDSILTYLTAEQVSENKDQNSSLEEQFMPLVINELIHRQIHIQQLAKEKAKTQELLIQNEKMAALGTISAGIAHELNNSIAVIQHCSDWLSHTIQDLLVIQEPQYSEVFAEGLEFGRKLSNKQIRDSALTLSKQYRISQNTAEMLVHINASTDRIKQLTANPTLLKTLHSNWELGATIRDMQTASDMATHVVRSVKAIGTNSSKKDSNVDINETIDKATTLLTSSLRLIHVQCDLQPLSLILCAKGEMIQVWVNLIKNALDSMFADSIKNPTIQITSQMVENSIQVKITDNGSGIPSEFIHQIFDPQFTTKSGESSVGLGLGLTIVNKIITSHHGTIHVESQPGNTTFTVTLPTGGHHE